MDIDRRNSVLVLERQSATGIGDNSTRRTADSDGLDSQRRSSGPLKPCPVPSHSPGPAVKDPRFLFGGRGFPDEARGFLLRNRHRGCLGINNGLSITVKYLAPSIPHIH